MIHEDGGRRGRMIITVDESLLAIRHTINLNRRDMEKVCMILLVSCHFGGPVVVVLFIWRLFVVFVVVAVVAAVFRQKTLAFIH